LIVAGPSSIAGSLGAVNFVVRRLKTRGVVLLSVSFLKVGGFSRADASFSLAFLQLRFLWVRSRHLLKTWEPPSMICQNELS
jgi:hypothetical protein